MICSECPIRRNIAEYPYTCPQSWCVLSRPAEPMPPEASLTPHEPLPLPPVPHLTREPRAAAVTDRSPAPLDRCVTCGAQAVLRCTFALMGPSIGQACARPVCARHAQQINRTHLYCLPHARFATAQGKD
mgnify:FL=1